jgi:hypothetical protein
MLALRLALRHQQIAGEKAVTRETEEMDWLTFRSPALDFSSLPVRLVRMI